MTPLRGLLLCAFLCAAAAGFAEVVPDASDPVVASPDKYHVLFENQHVRVVEYRIEPGERDNWHSHPPKIAYVVEPGTLRITTATGRSFVVEEQQGTARWLGAVGRHYGENIGATPVKIVFVEIKSVTDERQNLDTYLRGNVNDVD